jgi:hypothetical protein
MKSNRHELKTDPLPFAAILSGEKTHEIRYDDRGFLVGDTLALRETHYSRRAMREEARPLEYTGRTVERVVTHIQRGYGLPDGLVVMSLAPAALEAQLKEARNAALDEAALAIEDHDRLGRQWVPGSLWDNLSNEAAARVRALKVKP